MSNTVTFRDASGSVSIELVTETCANCGIIFAYPKWFRTWRQNDGARFYCPNGHALTFKQTEKDRLKEEIERLKRDQKWYEERLQREKRDSQYFRLSRNAYKGRVTKLNKRIAKGVCPCCTRTFTNLQRHIETKHPEFVAEIEKEVTE